MTKTTKIPRMAKPAAIAELPAITCDEMTASGHRPLHAFARLIANDWGSKMYFGARPYVRDMRSLVDVTDSVVYDDGLDVITRFLVNASTWRGPVARAVKAELVAIRDAEKKRRYGR